MYWSNHCRFVFISDMLTNTLADHTYHFTTTFSCLSREFNSLDWIMSAGAFTNHQGASALIGSISSDSSSLQRPKYKAYLFGRGGITFANMWGISNLCCHAKNTEYRHAEAKNQKIRIHISSVHCPCKLTNTGLGKSLSEFNGDGDRLINDFVKQRNL